MLVQSEICGTFDVIESSADHFKDLKPYVDEVKRSKCLFLPIT